MSTDSNLEILNRTSKIKIVEDSTAKKEDTTEQYLAKSMACESTNREAKH